MTGLEITQIILIIVLLIQSLYWQSRYKAERKRRRRLESILDVMSDKDHDHPIETPRVFRPRSRDEQLSFAESQLQKAIEEEDFEVAEQIKDDMERIKSQVS